MSYYDLLAQNKESVSHYASCHRLILAIRGTAQSPLAPVEAISDWSLRTSQAP